MHQLERLFRSPLPRRPAPPQPVSAVHDDDLQSFLGSLGALHDLTEGRLRCKFCKDTLNIETVQAIVPDSGAISYVCNKPTCLRHLMSYLEELDEPARVG